MAKDNPQSSRRTVTLRKAEKMPQIPGQQNNTGTSTAPPQAKSIRERKIPSRPAQRDRVCSKLAERDDRQDASASRSIQPSGVLLAQRRGAASRSIQPRGVLLAQRRGGGSGGGSRPGEIKHSVSYRRLHEAVFVLCRSCSHCFRLAVTPGGPALRRQEER